MGCQRSSFEYENHASQTVTSHRGYIATPLQSLPSFLHLGFFEAAPQSAATPVVWQCVRLPVAPLGCRSGNGHPPGLESLKAALVLPQLLFIHRNGCPAPRPRLPAHAHIAGSGHAEANLAGPGNRQEPVSVVGGRRSGMRRPVAVVAGRPGVLREWERIRGRSDGGGIQGREGPRAGTAGVGTSRHDWRTGQAVPSPVNGCANLFPAGPAAFRPSGSKATASTCAGRGVTSASTCWLWWRACPGSGLDGQGTRAAGGTFRLTRQGRGGAGERDEGRAGAA